MTERARRTVLKAAGASTLALAAGCLGGGGNGNGNGGDGGNGGNGGNGGSDGGDSGGNQIEPGTDIRFDGQTTGWVGLEPSSIADAENPTIVLQEGEDYTIGWTEGDGAQHNIEIRNSDGSVVDDLSTELTSEPGDDQILEFTASSEMAAYVCNPHESMMNGDIEVQ